MPRMGTSTAVAVATFLAAILLTCTSVTSAQDKNRALIDACWSGQAKVARLLLEQDADIDARDRDGLTALAWASKRGLDDVVKLLLAKGAEI